MAFTIIDESEYLSLKRIVKTLSEENERLKNLSITFEFNSDVDKGLKFNTKLDKGISLTENVEKKINTYIETIKPKLLETFKDKLQVQIINRNKAMMDFINDVKDKVNSKTSVLPYIHKQDMMFALDKLYNEIEDINKNIKID